MSRRRPWRAIATTSDPTTLTGRRITGQVAACTEDALAPWISARRAAGDAVTVQEVLALIPEDATSATPGRSPEPAPVA